MIIKCVFSEHFPPSFKKKKKDYIIASLLLPKTYCLLGCIDWAEDGVQENVRKEWFVLEVSPESACHVRTRHSCLSLHGLPPAVTSPS